MSNPEEVVKSSNWSEFAYLGGSCDHPSTQSAGLSLSRAQIGDHVQIMSFTSPQFSSRLLGMGLLPGEILQVVSITNAGSVVVALGNQRLGLGPEVAECIQVTPAPFQIKTIRNKPDTPTGITLRDAAIGSRLRVLGYAATARDYKRRLLSMGLTPGAELVIKRHAPLGDPTEIEVRGFLLSLRKDEADSLIVELNNP